MPFWSSAALALLSLLVLVVGVGMLLQRRRARARQLYQHHLVTALADGTLGQEEKAELEDLRAAKNLTAAEVRTIMRTIYRHALSEALRDERLSAEEDEQLRRLQQQLGLTDNELRNDHVQLSRLRMLAHLASGQLPSVLPPTPVVANEPCHWVVQCALAERLAVAGELVGVRIPVPGDAPFTLEGPRDSLRPSAAILPVDLGVLIVTSRRTVFQGAKRTMSVPHARVDAVVLYEDGLRLEELGGQTRGYLLVEDAEITGAVVLHAARRRRSEIRPVRTGRSA